MRGSEGVLIWRLNLNQTSTYSSIGLVMTMTFFLYTIKDRDECELTDEIHLPFRLFYLFEGERATSTIIRKRWKVYLPLWI
jgi:hypothetical protein